MPNYPYSFQLPPLNVQDIPNDGVAGEFLGISAGGVLDWLPVATGGGDMLKSENLSGLTSYPTARTNLGLGTGDSPTFANLTLTSPSLASSAPVTISQTWGTTGTYTAAKVNVTETATANPASLLLDLQLGGVTQVNSTKAGSLFARIFVSGNSQTSRAIEVAASGIAMGSLGVLAFAPASSYASNSDLFNVADTFLRRDGAANTLALRNGAAAQTFNVYGTYTSASVYERMFMRYNDTDLAFQVGAETLGATARPLQLWTGGASRLHITTAGNVGIGTTAPSEKLHVLGGKVLFGDISDPTGTAGNGELTLHARTLPQLNMVSNVGVNSFFGLSLKAGTTERAGFLVNMQSGEVKMGALSGAGYFPTFWSNGVEIMRFSTGGNVGIGTTSPTSNLHVAGNSSPAITVENTVATGYSELRFKNTVTTGSSIFLNGSAQSGYGGASSLNIYSISGPLAFHTASVTNALSIAQNGNATFFGGVTGWNIIALNYIGVPAGNGLTPNAGGINDYIKISSNGGSELVRFGYFGTAATSYISFGGVASTAPALKRSSTTLQARLADDSAFAPIQGKLTTETAFTATTVTPTGFITLYDSTGAAYKVPCVPA